MVGAIAASLLLALLPLPEASAAARHVRFEAAPEASLLVHGEYPRVESSCVDPHQPLLHARFRGAVEVARAADGSLYVIGELPFEDYLKGIAEVPRSWPMESLKAQVVAARTYAMTRLRRGSSEGRALGYDLCATVACQVYLGMGIEGGAWGERWVRAVEQTAGEVLLHGGKTADTLYSSTSNGRTYPNEKVFGGTPQPYLRGIIEEDDGESPLSRWRVSMPLGDLRRFLAAGGRWGSQPISSVEQRKGRIVVRGGGKRLRLGREELRDALNDVASCLDAGYPSREPDGYRLPQTVPSRWFSATQEGSTLVLDGRGWGHGVGMVQWGAKGKADRGLDHGEILAAYYGGLRPQRVTAAGTIRVLVADDLESVTVVPEGVASIERRPGAPPPPWRVSGGRRLRVRPGTEPAPELEVVLRGSEIDDDRVTARLRLSKDAKVRLELTSPGREPMTADWQPHRDGRVRLEVDASTFAPPGGYEARIAATDGVDLLTLPLGTVEVGAGSVTPSPDASPSVKPPASARPAARRTVPAWAIAAAAAALVALGALVLLRGRRKGFHRG